MIAGIIETFKPSTLKTKTLSDKTNNRFIAILKYGDTKEQVDSIIQKYKTKDNTDDNNEYTVEYINELTENIKSIKMKIRTQSDIEEIGNKYKNKLLEYLIIAIDINNLYMLSSVSVIIYLTGLTLVIEDNTLKLV